MTTQPRAIAPEHGQLPAATKSARRSWRRGASALLLALTALLGTVGVTEGTASAATSYCRNSTCSLASQPYTRFIYFEMPRATPVRMICWTSTQYWNGTAKWFKVSTIYGTGYMNANQVGGQTVVGRC